MRKDGLVYTFGTLESLNERFGVEIRTCGSISDMISQKCRVMTRAYERVRNGKLCYTEEDRRRLMAELAKTRSLEKLVRRRGIVTLGMRSDESARRRCYSCVLWETGGRESGQRWAEVNRGRV